MPGNGEQGHFDDLPSPRKDQEGLNRHFDDAGCDADYEGDDFSVHVSLLPRGVITFYLISGV